MFGCYDESRDVSGGGPVDAPVAPVERTAWEGEWPEGDMIPLNARCLTKPMLRQIGEALGVPSSSSATCAELKLMVEGKLTELGYDPSNI